MQSANNGENTGAELLSAGPRCVCGVPHWPRKLIAALRAEPNQPVVWLARRWLGADGRHGDYRVYRRIRRHLRICPGFAAELGALAPELVELIDLACERPPRPDRRRRGRGGGAG